MSPNTIEWQMYKIKASKMKIKLRIQAQNTTES
jgi:hypothetical protein